MRKHEASSIQEFRIFAEIIPFIMKKRIFVFTILAAFLSACSTYNVVHINELSEVPHSMGYYYALPRNVVSVDITVTKTKRIAGPYAKYASKYLGIKNALQSNSVNFEMTDIKLNVYAEADPEQYYFVDLSKFRGNKNQAMLMRLSESGLIQDVNDNSEDRVLQEKKERIEKTKIDYTTTFKYFADDNLKVRIDTIIEKVNIDTITIEKKIYRQRMVEKTMEEKAKEAADFIMKIKEQRLDIITGAQEVAYSDATVKIMNDELLKMEKDYMMLFTGLTETETFHYRYTYMPESQIFNASIPLFKFSKYAGVVEDDFDGGNMVYIHVDRAKSTMALADFASKNVPEKAHNKGFYYRIPEAAKFSILYGGDTQAEASFLISQFGQALYLPPVNAKIQYHPNTGALRKVELK